MTARTLITALLTALVACDPGEGDKPQLPPTQGGAPKIPVPGGNGGEAKARPQPGVRDMTRERYVGNARPKREAELGPKMSGTLAAVEVQEGDRVKKGQVLFRLDGRSTRLGVAAAEAGLQGAQIARDNAKRELERQQQLAAKGTIAAAVLERSEAAYNAALNGVSQAEVSVSMARRGSADSSVVSPIDGVVAHKLKSVGETVTMMPPTTVVVIQDQSVLEVRVRVPEAALKLLHEGDIVTAHFTALEVEREATIARIQPTVDAATRTIEIVADVDNADGVLRPGMYVEVELRPPLASVLPPRPEAPVAPAPDPAAPAPAPAPAGAGGAASAP